MLRIALPNKGRLSDDTRELFRDAGLDIRSVGDRALTASLGDDFEAIFVRSQDVAEFVADGAADAGVTGFDLVEESGREVAPLLDLGFGRCRVVVATRDDSSVRDLSEIPPSSRVATVFPRIAAAFFSKRAQTITVVPVTGATEMAPRLGIADFIVDITSTGSTLRMNGLREIATVFDSSARLIGSVTAMRDPTRSGTLKELIAALESVLGARGKRYLMANVPRSMLGQVRTILPGINGPTVVDILDGDQMVAVHAVVSEKAIYRTIASLKALGAAGILVTRIERLTA
jgi:ATP phosphoribosyltransferase